MPACLIAWRVLQQCGSTDPAFQLRLVPVWLLCLRASVLVPGCKKCWLCLLASLHGGFSNKAAARTLRSSCGLCLSGFCACAPVCLCRDVKSAGYACLPHCMAGSPTRRQHGPCVPAAACACLASVPARQCA